MGEVRKDVFMFVPPGEKILILDVFRPSLQVTCDLVNEIIDGCDGLKNGKVVEDIFQPLLGRFGLQSNQDSKDMNNIYIE